MTRRAARGTRGSISGRRLLAFTLAMAVLGSGAWAWCRQHVTVSEPDGTVAVCDWYCVVPPNGVITSGCKN